MITPRFNIIYLSITILMLIHLGSVAQTKQDRKAYMKKLQLADEYYKYENFKESALLYKELYYLDTNNLEVNYKLGVSIFLNYRNKLPALKHFEKCKDLHLDAYFYLGRLYQDQSNFYQAKLNYNYYKNNRTAYTGRAKEDVDFYLNQITVAEKLIQEPVHVTITNIGNVINSEYPDYVPVISSDESTMFFTSRRPGSTGGYLDPNNEFFEDIYYSTRVDGEWQKPINLGAPVNTAFHDACVTLSADGQQLYIFRTNSLLTGGDIYLSQLKLGSWTEPQKLKADINTKYGYVPSITLSPDEQTIYFVSDRPGGYGGKDIYKIEKLPNNEWSYAENLGPTINTPYDEDAPFMHPDGKTLYFSSKGHQNMGGYDIFMTKRNENGNWTIPQNMGYPINTVQDDIFFVVSANGKRGYFSSDRLGGLGYSDIYVIDMPDYEADYVMLKGKIINKLNFMPLQATITLIDQTTKKVTGIYRPNPATGKYVMIVSENKKYKLIVEADGFQNYIEEIFVPENLPEKVINKNLRLSISLVKTSDE